MKVLKFGGTSVGSAKNIENVKNIVASQSGQKIVVLSAMAGVTNALVTLTDFMKEGNLSEIDLILKRLQEQHYLCVDELFASNAPKQSVKTELSRQFQQLKEITKKDFSKSIYAEVITFGEIFSTSMVSAYFKSMEMDNILLDAKKFMHVENLENPDTTKIGGLFNRSIKKYQNEAIFITQGFVCLDKNQKISTLKRGGSDYTATILGGAVEASEVQIWTDIDGLHNNDPRYVEGTHAISHLTFKEAAELAYFGAKILHPQTVSPLIHTKIPIFLKNTFSPQAPGTQISSEEKSKGLKAISAKDGITAIKIKSNRMLMAHGFLRKIFDVFDTYETSIDMITTSEVAISLTIDDIANLTPILAELEKYGEITVEKEHSIICIVGDELIEDEKTFKLFELLNDIPIRMISYGGSSNNVSLLVNTANKVTALQKLNEKLFLSALKMN